MNKLLYVSIMGIAMLIKIYDVLVDIVDLINAYLWEWMQKQYKMTVIGLGRRKRSK